MDDQTILERVHALIEQEHELRTKLQEGAIDAETEHARLRAAEEELDQCWDLLRQRRARRSTGGSGDEAAPRPVSVVENYLQ